MRYDNEKIKRLSAMSDAALWQEIRSMLSGYGIRLPDKMPSHEDMQNLRRAFTLGEGISPMEAARLIGEYKRKYMR